MATLHAEEIISKAEHLGSEPDYKGRLEIKAVHRYGASIEIDGEKYSVVVVVMEASDGKRYYDHTVTGKDESPAGLLADPSTSEVDEESWRPFTGLPLDENIDQLPEKSSEQQSHIDTLQSIVDGNSDGEDLDTLLDKIDVSGMALDASITPPGPTEGA